MVRNPAKFIPILVPSDLETDWVRRMQLKGFHDLIFSTTFAGFLWGPQCEKKWMNRSIVSHFGRIGEAQETFVLEKELRMPHSPSNRGTSVSPVGSHARYTLRLCDRPCGLCVHCYSHCWQWPLQQNYCLLGVLRSMKTCFDGSIICFAYCHRSNPC